MIWDWCFSEILMTSTLNWSTLAAQWTTQARNKCVPSLFPFINPLLYLNPSCHYLNLPQKNTENSITVGGFNFGQLWGQPTGQLSSTYPSWQWLATGEEAGRTRGASAMSLWLGK